MRKLVAAALLVLFAVAVASAATTITTTTVVMEVDANPTQHCQQQIQQQRQQLRHCTMWMQSQGRRSPRSVNLRMMVAEEEVNPREEEQHQDQCCRALERVDEQCRCEAVMLAVQGVRSEGRVQEEEMREVRSMAQNLPGRCGFEPRQCQIGAIWF